MPGLGIGGHETEQTELVWKELADTCMSLGLEWVPLARRLALQTVDGRRVEVPIKGTDQARSMLGSGALRARFVGDLRAVWWESAARLEAEIDPTGSGDRLSSAAARQFEGFTPLGPAEGDDWEVRIENCPPGVKSIALGTASPMLTCLVTGNAHSRRRLALRIRYHRGKEPLPADMEEELRRIADGVLFSVGTARGGIGYRLQPRSDATKPADPFEQRRTEVNRWRHPDRAYERVPMHYYRHARTAVEPTEQFMGYYRVLEYYFLRRMEHAVEQEIETLRGEPNLSEGSDEWYARVEEVRKERDNERAQLLIVLSACVKDGEFSNALKQPGAVKAFTAANGVLGWMNGKQPAKPPSSSQPNLVEIFAPLLYQLRCRIVHAKDGGASRNGFVEHPILPASREGEALWPYIHMLRWAAERALIRIPRAASAGP